VTAGRRRPAGQAGFTIVEVMIAMLVLVVGLLGVASMLSAASRTTASNKAREQAVALSRELVEAARSQAYANLDPSSAASLVQATPSLGDGGSAAGWQVERRNVSFNVAVGVCAVDDPNDGTGTRDATVFCANGAGATPPATCQSGYGAGDSIAGNGTLSGATAGDCGLDLNRDGTVDGLTGTCPTTTCPTVAKEDKNPEDFKRLVVLVRWKSGAGTKYVLQNTTITNPGFSAAPNVTSLLPNPAIPGDVVTAGTSVTFDATTNRPAATLGWYVDGTPQDSSPATGGPVNWAFTWSLGNVGATAPASGQVLDGDYLVEARAFDKYGQYGPKRPYALRVNRRHPYPVAGFQAVRVGSVVELDWPRSAEGDVVAYRVVRRVDAGAATELCPPSGATSCRDDAPPASGSVTYTLYAIDSDPSSGAARDGDATTDAAIPMANLAPSAPSTLSWAGTGDGRGITLTWPAASDPDGSVTTYAVYRDGQALSDLFTYVTVTGAGPYTWTDTSGMGHSYWIAAVDADDAQSTKSPGVVTG
jgi:type IV pilus assembly protein PilV